jgi:hypothetical protein
VSEPVKEIPAYLTILEKYEVYSFFYYQMVVFRKYYTAGNVMAQNSAIQIEKAASSVGRGSPSIVSMG